MEFDKQILNSHALVSLQDSFSRPNQQVCRYRGHGILLYGHGKVMEFCREDFVATLCMWKTCDTWCVTCVTHNLKQDLFFPCKGESNIFGLLKCTYNRRNVSCILIPGKRFRTLGTQKWFVSSMGASVDLQIKPMFIRLTTFSTKILVLLSVFFWVRCDVTLQGWSHLSYKIQKKSLSSPLIHYRWYRRHLMDWPSFC